MKIQVHFHNLVGKVEVFRVVGDLKEVEELKGKPSPPRTRSDGDGLWGLRTLANGKTNSMSTL